MSVVPERSLLSLVLDMDLFLVKTKQGIRPTSQARIRRQDSGTTEIKVAGRGASEIDDMNAVPGPSNVVPFWVGIAFWLADQIN